MQMKKGGSGGLGMRNYIESITTIANINDDAFPKQEAISMFSAAKVFELDRDITALLKDTNNPIRLVKLPFPVIFIDTELVFELGGGIIKLPGFLVAEGEKLDNGNIIEVWAVEKYEKIPKGFLDMVHVKGVECWENFDPRIHKVTSLGFWTSGNLNISKDKLEKRKRELFKKEPFSKILYIEEETVLTFIMNFLDFLNDPDVELKEMVRTQKSMQKRIKKGKIPLPPSKVVRIKGVLGEYINKLKSGRHFTYSHKFWVRGHWRTLEGDRWKTKKGMRIWIPPFIKGSGVLIGKRYNVKQ